MVQVKKITHARLEARGACKIRKTSSHHSSLRLLSALELQWRELTAARECLWHIRLGHIRPEPKPALECIAN